MLSRFRTILLGSFATCLFSVIHGQDRAVGDPALAPLRAAWAAELPFSPDAARVQGDRLVLARLAGSSLEVTSATLTAAGPGEFDPVVSRPLSRLSPGASKLFATRGPWVLVDEQSPSLTLLDDLAAEAPAAATVESPFDRVDEVLATGGDKLFVLGATLGELWVAGAVLQDLQAATAGVWPWHRGTPAPEPRRGASLVASHARLHLVGGTFAGPDGQEFDLRDVYRAQYDSAAQPTSWQAVVQRLPRGIGAARAQEINDLLVVMGEKTRPGDAATSQSIITAVDREGGFLSIWRELVLETPALEGGLPVALESTHQLLVLGGRQADGGTNRMAWAFDMAPTPQSMRPRTDTPVLRDHPRRRTLIDYRLGLRRANEEERHHVVFLLDDGEASQHLRLLLNTDRNFYVMLGEFILSEPHGERDTAEVAQKAGTEMRPAILLLDRDGYVMRVHQGLPDRQQLADFLRVVWDP